MTQHNPDKAPLFGRWSAWYILLMVFLGLLIILFNLLTKRYA